MAQIITVHGSDDLFKALEEHKGNTEVYVIFYGNPTEASPISFCPDCVVAEPVLRKCIAKMAASAIVIYCYVGDNPTWKDPSNAFRTNPKLRLTSVPTLWSPTKNQKLGEAECAKEDLVEMMLLED